MSRNPSSGEAPPFQLGELLALLVRDLPAQQRRLDQEYLGRALAFAPVFEQAKAAGLVAVANAVLPSAMVIENCDLTVALAAETSTGSELQVNFKLLHAGYLRRYQYTKTSRHEIRLKVQRAPLPPGSLPLRSP